MPFLDSQALDEQPLIDGNTTFAGGQVSATRPDNVAETAFAESVNMDYDDFGVLVSRVGCVSLVGNPESRVYEQINVAHNLLTTYFGSNLPTDANIISAFYFDTAAAERVVAALTTGGNRRIYYGTPSSSWQQIAGATYDASAVYVYFAQLNERLYYCDGASTLKYITAANADTSVTAGKVSRIDVINDGGGGLSAIPTVTIAAPPSGVTATAEAAVTGTGIVSAISITNPGSGYVTAPSVSIGGGGGVHAVAYVSLAPPGKPQFLVSHTNRLFCASADTANTPDTLFFSDILDGETWDPAGSIRVGGDGDPITALYSWFGYRLVVFKERSIWIVDADPTQDPADWTVQLLTGNVGCVSHRSVASVGPDVFFLSRDGVRALSQIQSGTQTDVGLPLSAPIDDLWAQVNKAQLALCDGVFWGNRYLLSVPYGQSQTSANAVFVYHALARTWVGRWTGWNVRDFFPTAFASQGPLLMFAGSIGTASGDGQVFAFNDFVPTSRTNPAPVQTWYDAGKPYQSVVTTRAYNFKEPLPQKTGYNVQLAIDNPFSTYSPTLTMAFAADMGAAFTALETDWAVASPTNRQKYQRAWNLISRGRFNSLQFQVSTNASTGGRLSVHSVVATAFIDPIMPQQ